MKKILALTMVLAMVLVVAGCTTTKDNGTSGSGSVSGGSNSESSPASGATKTGLGTYISLADSKNSSEDRPSTAQADVTMIAATFDEAGKIVKISIDVAQTKIEFDEKGQLKTDISAAAKTKRELGADYGMIAGSEIGKEWFEQADALEQWMMGKTVEEVKAMKTYEKDANHPQVPDEEDLKTSVTMNVGDYIKALENAYQNAK